MLGETPNGSETMQYRVEVNTQLRQRIICLSYYFSTDRILLYTKFLGSLTDQFDLSVWSFAIKEKNFPVSNVNAKHFELLKGKDSVPQWLNLARHFADYVWDHKGISKSRETMWRLRKAGATSFHEKTLWKAAKLTTAVRNSANFDRHVERLMLGHGYCDESLRDFETDRPAAVIAMVPFTPLHMSIVASARKLGIPVIAYITSWDNITTKPRLTFEYDGYLVWSETMKEELVEFHPQSKKKPIHVVGAPQYDIFLNESFYETKEEFLSRNGLGENKKTILYCLGSPNFIPEDHGVATFLDRLDAELENETQIVIRLHPGFYEHDYKVIPELRRKHKNIIFQGNKKYFDEHPLQPEDSIIDWVNTFRHVDVVVNLASTVTVDAAIFDKPIININFDSQSGAPDQQLVEEINSKWNHFSPIVRSGGVWNVNSNAEMMEAIKGYLQDPSLHREGRQRIVEYVCGTFDGRSGERMANAVCSILSKREVGIGAR